MGEYEDFIEDYVHVTLDEVQWAEIIRRAMSADEKDVHLFILRSWANSQLVTAASINAFRGTVMEVHDDRDKANLAISTIIRWIRSISPVKSATCYFWNAVSGEWSISSAQMKSLRKAFGASSYPTLS